jgi:rare lipoprotein A
MILARKYNFFSLFLLLSLTFSLPSLAKPAKGATQTGLASWYGIKFQGRTTSSGEPYDRHELTAAHKTLPLQTIVRVTNLKNDESVIVRINDRGPFVGKRIIDLSEAAAKEIGYRKHGITKVKVEVIQYPQSATDFQAKAAFSRVAAKKKRPVYSFAFVKPEVSRIEARTYLVKLPSPFFKLKALPEAALNPDQATTAAWLLLSSLPQINPDGYPIAWLQPDTGWFADRGEAALTRHKYLQKGSHRLKQQISPLTS